MFICEPKNRIPVEGRLHLLTPPPPLKSGCLYVGLAWVRVSDGILISSTQIYSPSKCTVTIYVLMKLRVIQVNVFSVGGDVFASYTAIFLDWCC